MKVKNLTNSPKVPFNLEAYILHSEGQIELVHLLLKPYESLDEHKNPFDVIFFVIQSSGVLTIDGEKVQLAQNDTIKVTSDKMRGWNNNGEEELRLLVIKLL